jgi:hypothetical protein
MPASSETSTATYEVADGNTLRVRYHNPQYEAEGYMGWNASSKRWWSDGADRYGTVYALNGVETAPDVQVLTGTTWSRHGASPSKDTYTKISDTAYRDVTEAKGPKGMLKIQAACTKNSGGAM